MKATHIESTTVVGNEGAALVVTPTYSQVVPADYSNEAAELAMFLRETFSNSTIAALKDLL